MLGGFMVARESEDISMRALWPSESRWDDKINPTAAYKNQDFIKLANFKKARHANLGVPFTL